MNSPKLGDANIISVLEPRWHDRTVLVADWKISTHNYVRIEHKDFPDPFYLKGEKAREFPVEKMKTKQGREVDMRAIPLDKLREEVV